MKKDKSFTNISNYRFNPFVKFSKPFQKDHSVIISTAAKPRDTSKKHNDQKKHQSKKEETEESYNDCYSEEMSSISEVKVFEDSSCSSIFLDNVQQHKTTPKNLSDEELANIVFQSGGTIDDVYYIKKWIDAGLITP